MRLEGHVDQDVGSAAGLGVFLGELLDEVVSDVLKEVTDEMDRMSLTERAQLLVAVLREAGV